MKFSRGASMLRSKICTVLLPASYQSYPNMFVAAAFSFVARASFTSFMLLADTADK